MTRKVKQTLAEAINSANFLARTRREAFGVQEWKAHDGSASDFIVAHGYHDGVGLTVYCALIPKEDR